MLQKNKSYVYCPYCDKLFSGWDIEEYKKHPHHDGSLLDYPGVYIKVMITTKYIIIYLVQFLIVIDSIDFL